jgi:hypothetical protein
MIFLGVFLGALLGFLLRPSVPLIGQLPFEVVINGGSNLTGLDTILKPAAEESFNYLMAGVFIGGIGGALVRSIRRSSTEEHRILGKVIQHQVLIRRNPIRRCFVPSVVALS